MHFCSQQEFRLGVKCIFGVSRSSVRSKNAFLVSAGVPFGGKNVFWVSAGVPFGGKMYFCCQREFRLEKKCIFVVIKHLDR